VENADGGGEGETADVGGIRAVEACAHSGGGGCFRDLCDHCVLRRGSESEDEKKGKEHVGEDEGGVEVVDTVEQKRNSGRPAGGSLVEMW
jgi:hypothetical protein